MTHRMLIRPVLAKHCIIPEDVQSVTRFAAGIPVNAEHPAEAKALLQFLASPAAQPVVQATGLDSVSR